MKKIYVGMCKTRSHEAMEEYVDDFLFDRVENVKDLRYQENKILFKLYQNMARYCGTSDFMPNEFQCNIYVNGITVALISAINVCNDLGMGIVLWHWDKTSNKYYPQEIR